MRLPLKALRESKGMTQAELGRKLDLAPSTVAMYESGKRTPDADNLVRIARIFNVSVDYLLGNESPMSYVSSPHDDSESALLSGYRKLNDLGKQTILSLIGQLTGGQSIARGVVKGNITGNNGYVNVGGVHMTGTAI